MKNYYDSVRYDINAHEKVSAANNEGWRQFFRELFHRFPEARVTSLTGEKSNWKYFVCLARLTLQLSTISQYVISRYGFCSNSWSQGYNGAVSFAGIMPLL